MRLRVDRLEVGDQSLAVRNDFMVVPRAVILRN
jgi:hypothetical protein